MDDCPPPWVALPGLTPDDPATQGAAEAYYVLTWLPFWRTLSVEGKTDYLDRWRADPDWRAAIAERFDWDPAEMADDADESARMLAARPRPPGRRWWWWR